MAMKQLDLFSTQPTAPPPLPQGRPDPLVWLSQLLLLRAPDLAEPSIIRQIPLRRGLNILWAPPTADSPENRLGDGQITGHTAGKTTFCRCIRYLLGEPRFGTESVEDRIREALPEGWIVGEVFVANQRWIVGRPFAPRTHSFAVQGASLPEALLSRNGGGYPEFLAALNRAVIEPTKVKELPHARSPFLWEHALAWTARDQEARFAGLVAFRDASSESESPRLTLDDRHVVVRALLGLMSDEEGELERRYEELSQEKLRLEQEAPLLADRAAEDRRRLRKRLGLSPSDDNEAESGPLFAARLHNHLAERRATLETAEREIEERKAEVDRAREACRAAAEACGGLRQETREAEKRLASARRALDRIEPSTAQDTDLPITQDRCSVPLRLALAKGCPLAAAHVEVRPDEQAVSVCEGALAEASRALTEARAEERALATEHERLAKTHGEERDRVADLRASITELGSLFAYMQEGERAADQSARRLARVSDELARSLDLQAALRREHGEAQARLSDRFRDVVRALLGEHVAARVDVKGRRIELIVEDRGERDGAAMTTIKLLAFDLAALKLGLDGHGQFPGLLVHDGPREADMDGRIYERLFLYAKHLENGAAPGFQYLITTTAPPPPSLSRAPWLLSPLLDASKPEGRLLKVDL